MSQFYYSDSYLHSYTYPILNLSLSIYRYTIACYYCPFGVPFY